MTKKRSRCLFVVFAIILVVCLIACFVSFEYPFSISGNYYSYSSFASNIKFGEDIGNSYRIIYRADLPEDELAANYNNLRTSTINELKQIVQSEGFKDVIVTEYGEDCILVQFGNILSVDDTNSIKNLIGDPKSITFSTNSDGTNPFATGKSISNVYATQSTNGGNLYYYGVVQFNSSVDLPEDETTIYIYLGETNFGSSSVNNGVVTLYNSSFKSLSDAQRVVNQVKSGMMDLELTTIEIANITPSYGVGGYVFAWIAMAILVLSAFVFLIVKYRHAGWLASFALLFYIVIALFLLQSIPAMHINFAGVLAMMLGFVLAVDSLIVILESAKKYYQEDTKLYIAFKAAQKDNLFKILIINIVALAVGFVCLFMPTLSIQSFGWVMFVLPFVSAFVSLVLMKLFINMYLALNSTNGKKCNFHKGGKNA